MAAMVHGAALGIAVAQWSVVDAVVRVFRAIEPTIAQIAAQTSTFAIWQTIGQLVTDACILNVVGTWA